MTLRHRLNAAIASSLLLAATPAAAQNPTVAGELWIEPSTLISLGFDWTISGDDNRNAQVEVTFRKKGEQPWRQALPLIRLQHEKVYGPPDRAGVPSPFSYTAPNMFSGSIFDLEPGATYEVRLALSDPDGVKGDARKTVTVQTRKEPQPAAGGKVYHVYPVGWTGPRQEPWFTGLIAAYYMGSHQTDFQNAYPPRVQPGDVILVHAGLYKATPDRYHYVNGPMPPEAPDLCCGMGLLFDGTYHLIQSGTPDRPIVIKAAGDGEVIFDGDGAQNLFNIMGANYNYFEGLTIRNTNIAFLAGLKGVAGASGFTLKNSRLYDVGRAVQNEWSGSRDFYIADNVFIGRHDPDKLLGWNAAIWRPFPGFPATVESEYAIKVYGQGHVVAHNYLAHWHDGIDVATYGNPDGTPAERRERFPMSIDFYNNDMYNMADNCIEGDGGGRNIRVFRNRCFNSAAGALSAQPIFGGPIYFFQNIVYNTPGSGSLKYVAAPAGVLNYQNTLIGEAGVAGPASNVHFRNNLILAQGALPAVFRVGTFTNYSTSDYNGFRPNPGAEVSFEWNSPPRGVVADYEKPLEVRRFRTLREYSQQSGQDTHSVLIDYDVFVNVSTPDITDPQRLYNPGAFDFRLKPGSAAVDAGVVLPNINDGHTGRAPDLGALEVDRPIPLYGPRTGVVAPAATP